jgi:hypothetical protein
MDGRPDAVLRHDHLPLPRCRCDRRLHYTKD